MLFTLQTRVSQPTSPTRVNMAHAMCVRHVAQCIVPNLIHCAMYFKYTQVAQCATANVKIYKVVGYPALSVWQDLQRHLLEAGPLRAAPHTHCVFGVHGVAPQHLPRSRVGSEQHTCTKEVEPGIGWSRVITGQASSIMHMPH